jgi:carbon-monoxide dehydrogenase small subunit
MTGRDISPAHVAPRVVTLTVNGAPRTATVRPYDVLLDVLREELNLTGTKRGCDMGTCGCCTVHLDGRPRLSCLTLALDCADKAITTIEGLRPDARLDTVQRFFAETGGSQCGFCTPGFIMTARALLDANPNPDDAEIREAISGNVCRCTGYVKIIEAIRRAAAEERITAAER